MALRANGLTPATVFDLLGRDENSATFALGWVLEECGCFRKAVVQDLTSVTITPEEEFTIHLQRHAEDGGYTDLEIGVPNRCLIVIEAKKGWVLPEPTQLLRYVGRLRQSTAEISRIVSLSAVNREYAERTQSSDIDGVVRIHRSWKDIRLLATLAMSIAGRAEERLWLSSLVRHLREYEQMSNVSDNTVFVVSLSDKPMRADRRHTWIDVVKHDGRYFHPVGNRWPVEPPNYIGFRYHGRLQSVHHIEDHTTVRDVSSLNPNWCETNVDHFVYTLGPAMYPPIEVKSGAIWHRRVRCAIDTLLSGAFRTISDAERETAHRLAETA